MNLWVLLLLLGFAQDIPFLLHEVTAAANSTSTTSSHVKINTTVAHDSSTLRTTTNITSETNSASRAPTVSTLITSTNIQTSSIATGLETTTIITNSKEPIITDSKEPHTSQETSPTSPSTAEAAQSSKEPKLSQNPGVVAVICVFVLVLVIAGVVALVKICHRREPAFKKLDEVPMGKVAEDSPFARYPPK